MSETNTTKSRTATTAKSATLQSEKSGASALQSEKSIAGTTLKSGKAGTVKSVTLASAKSEKISCSTKSRATAKSKSGVSKSATSESGTSKVDTTKSGTTAKSGRTTKSGTTAKSVTVKTIKSSCSKPKSVRSEKLLGVTDIDPDEEKCGVPRKFRAKKRAKRDPCSNQQSQWDCAGDPLWRSYMKTLAEDASKRMEAEREARCLYPDKKPKQFPVPCLPCPPPVEFRYELYALNQGRKIIDVLGPTTAGIWDTMRDPRPCIESASFVSSEFDWPRLYPCTTRDVVRERKILARKLKMRALGASPCEVDEINSPDSSDDERQQELAHQKELVHVRIPYTRPKGNDIQYVDQASGEHPGLVDGDYVIFQLESSKCGGSRTYTNVVLRGLTGMPLTELGRTREKTWKFCMFQALVALLAKTQLRYKFVWSANVDYIYNHAWMIFLHVGYLNLREHQRFDDLLVYNYKYSVELELVHELKNVRVVQDIPFDYYERTLKRHRQLPRKELTLVKNTFSTEKVPDEYGAFVHRETRKIEKWFDALDEVYSNCIFRTSRFSLAFWQDGCFWYLYNPYRCDNFGFWKDNGQACFVKFCSKDSLKRHLVILTLRAYAYESEVQSGKGNECFSECYSTTTKSFASSLGKRKKFTVQIYQLLHHSCHIHNVKLLLREPWKPKPQMVEKKKSNPCVFDPLMGLTIKPCEEVKDDNYEMEKLKWLDEKIIWAKYPAPAPSKKGCGQGTEETPKWHHFEVIESKRLYILWGKMHILQKVFTEENRGNQAITCYAVCAGMCLINTPEYWDAGVLDAIVVCGDKFYTKRYERKEPCATKNDRANLPIDDWDERPSDKFRIGEIVFDVLAKSSTHGRLFYRNNQCLWQTLQQFFQKHTFGILSCESAQLAVFKHYGVYYLLDVASYGPPIFEKGAGLVYLLRATCFIDLMKNLILVIGSPECRSFKLRPIEIVKVLDLADADECGRVKVDNCEKKDDLFKTICPKDKKKKKGVKSSGGSGKTFDQKVCTNNDRTMGCQGLFR